MILEEYESRIIMISFILILLNEGFFTKRKVVKREFFVWGLFRWIFFRCLLRLVNLR